MSISSHEISLSLRSDRFVDCIHALGRRGVPDCWSAIQLRTSVVFYMVVIAYILTCTLYNYRQR